jgi:hypothetical protein
MKLNDLIVLFESGKRPVIQINEANIKVGESVYENGAVVYGDFSPNQRARIVGVTKKEDDLALITVDMSEFYDYNCQVDEGNHYGPDRNKLYKWHELDSYPKDHKTDLYVGEIVIEFKLVGDRFTRFLDDWTADKSNNLSYVEWLENKVMEGVA